MKIGLLAPELTPTPAGGGMSTFARELAAALSEDDQVTVYTRTHRGPVPELRCEQRPVLTGDLSIDARVLAPESADVWFASNASLVALAPFLKQPLVPYFNGNDVLNPWLVFPRPWIDRLEAQHFVWRFAPALRRKARTHDMRRGMRASPVLTANSTNTARLVDRVYPGFADKLRVIPPGVGEQFFQTRAPAQPAGEPLRLLTVSRLERWTARKNVDSVLQALRMLPASLAVSYRVVGDGDDRPRLETLARELGVMDRVEFLGAVDDETLRRCYREADLFILASRARERDVEGFGIVYLEASAAGTPVICSRAGGATDAVVEGENGVVLEGASAEEIAAAIVHFSEDRARFPADRVQGVAERFRWPAIAARFRALLEGVVSG